MELAVYSLQFTVGSHGRPETGNYQLSTINWKLSTGNFEGVPVLAGKTNGETRETQEGASPGRLTRESRSSVG